MRLLHCSDLHLDARMTAHLDARAAKQRREELLMTFGNIAETARRERVRAVLIAGDLFDTERVTVRTRQYVGQIIAEYAEITFLYVSGNHDRDVQPIFPDNAIPINWVDLTGEDWSGVQLHENGLTISVSGTSATEKDEIYATVPQTEYFHIVMLHGDTKKSGGAARDKVCLHRLVGKGIGYLALGHIHSYRSEMLGERGVWCYSGCPEGRGFDECGEKGVVLLELTPNTATPSGVSLQYRFLPIARRTLHQVQLDVSRCENDRALLSAAMALAEGIPASDMIFLALQGEVPPEFAPNTGAIQMALRERFFAAKVENETRLVLHPEEYMHDVSLKGEFIRAVLASKMSAEQKDRVIICGLRALRGEEAEL